MLWPDPELLGHDRGWHLWDKNKERSFVRDDLSAENFDPKSKEVQSLEFFLPSEDLLQKTRAWQSPQEKSRGLESSEVIWARTDSVLGKA